MIYIMCNVCCKEFKGWCRSFTKLEATLSLAQLTFFIILIAVLTFVIFHFVSCCKGKDKFLKEHITTPGYETTHTTGKVITHYETHASESVKCTWSPSQKTKALTHYYESIETEASMKTTVSSDDRLLDDETLDENVEFFIALVKYKPPQGITFGCTLTIISEKWTLTAATCIEAIEELDSLDSFVMMEGLGTGSPGKLHAVSDVMIHPQYEGFNRNYDLAAIKSEDSLIKERKLISLPTLIDLMSITIGENMQLYGFGRYRSIDKDPLTRQIHHVKVHKLPTKHCPSTNNTWSPRHLVRGQPVSQGSCGRAPICAGVLNNFRTPCNYCAGAPLVYRGALLGLMSDNPNCGISCDPVLFVNIVATRDWLDSLVNSD